MSARSNRPAKIRRWRRITVIAGIVVALLLAAALWQRANPFTIRTAITVDAPPERVWAVLTEFDAYGEWNPSLIGMTGELTPGSTLRFATDDTADALTFEPTVRDVEPNERLRWEGIFVVPGIFDGEHGFTLSRQPDGTTELVQYEHFRGVAVPFLTGWLNDNTLPDFVAMNEALRDRVESGN